MSVDQRLFRHGMDPSSRSPSAFLDARRQASDLEQQVGRLLREAHLEDGTATPFEPSELPDLDALQAELEPDTVLLEYFLTEEFADGPGH